MAHLLPRSEVMARRIAEYLDVGIQITVPVGSGMGLLEAHTHLALNPLARNAR